MEQEHKGNNTNVFLFFIFLHDHKLLCSNSVCVNVYLMSDFSVCPLQRLNTRRELHRSAFAPESFLKR